MAPVRGQVIMTWRQRFNAYFTVLDEDSNRTFRASLKPAQVEDFIREILEEERQVIANEINTIRKPRGGLISLAWNNCISAIQRLLVQ